MYDKAYLTLGIDIRTALQQHAQVISASSRCRENHSRRTILELSKMKRVSAKTVECQN
jgi:hypothetical protein